MGSFSCRCQPRALFLHPTAPVQPAMMPLQQEGWSGGVKLSFLVGGGGGGERERNSKQAKKLTPSHLHFSLGWEFLCALSHRREISG